MSTDFCFGGVLAMFLQPLLQPKVSLPATGSLHNSSFPADVSRGPTCPEMLSTSRLHPCCPRRITEYKYSVHSNGENIYHLNTQERRSSLGSQKKGVALFLS